MRKGQSNQQQRRQPVEFDGRPTYSVDAKRAAEFIGVSERTLANWRSAKPRRGPRFSRLEGGKVVYRCADLMDYVDSQAV